MFLATKNCCTGEAVWADTLVWWTTQSWFCQCLGQFQQTSYLIVKPPTSNAGKLFGLEEQICNELCPQIKSPVCSWCVIWLLYFCWAWRGSIFPLRKMMFTFWVITVNRHLVASIFHEVLQSLKQTLMQVFCVVIKGIRKSWFTLNMHKSTYILRSNAEGYSCRTY